MKVRVRPIHRGPLVIELGEGVALEVLDLEGAPIEFSSRKVRLCRCGVSCARPLCDGSHSRTRFEAPEPEPETDDEIAPG
jgi:CDGSH-type Zn-finger protein